MHSSSPTDAVWRNDYYEHPSVSKDYLAVISPAPKLPRLWDMVRHSISAPIVRARDRSLQCSPANWLYLRVIVRDFQMEAVHQTFSFGSSLNVLSLYEFTYDLQIPRQRQTGIQILS